MPRTIAISISPSEAARASAELSPSPLYYSVLDGAAQLYSGDGKPIPTSKIADGKAFLMDMHAARARNAPELAAIARLYVSPDHEIAAIALPAVTPDPIRVELSDWRLGDHPDTGSWPDDPVATEPREVIITHDDAMVFLTMPIPGEEGALSIGVELQGRRLIVHAYDSDHESPVNLRIGETSILIDSHDRDAEEAQRSPHPSPSVGK